MQRAVRNLAANPARGMRLSLGMVRDVADAAGITSVSDLAVRSRKALVSATRRAEPDSDTSASVSPPISSAPPTPWNKSVTPHRRSAMRSAALDNLKRLKVATESTLNDVVMAVCAGALCQYLVEHDALPNKPLRAMVPVGIRTGDEEDPWTNQVSAVVADLPTDCDDPIEPIARSREAMNAAKRQFDLMPGDVAAGTEKDPTKAAPMAGAKKTKKK